MSQVHAPTIHELPDSEQLMTEDDRSLWMMINTPATVTAQSMRQGVSFGDESFWQRVLLATKPPGFHCVGTQYLPVKAVAWMIFCIHMPWLHSHAYVPQS